ncbi:MAG: metalloregulator ArsR/SmtB family transcription factor [Thermaerobacter sp.]|nr:metalloregulator ArsR/SmtB family transcription factor [Thermaerobacter sp.]
MFGDCDKEEGVHIQPESLPPSEQELLELHAKFFRGLANPLRLQIIELLLDGEKNVSELVHRTGVTQGQVSNALACLRWCGYVASRQEGRYTFYRIAHHRVRDLVLAAREMVALNAAHIYSCCRM